MSKKIVTVISCDTKIACKGNSVEWDGLAFPYPAGWGKDQSGSQDACPACFKALNTPANQPTPTQPVAEEVTESEEAGVA
jgi:hypothetical protein